VGPRLNFTSAFSTNAVNICHNIGLPVARLERFRRYRLVAAGGGAPSLADADAFAQLVHDRMTEWRITAPLTTFETGIKPVPVHVVPLLERGVAALEEVNKEMGLSMDAWDIDFYYRLFAEDLKRNPTDVELFDISQSNSEHSRHWFFKGRIVIDGAEQPRTLFRVVQDTLDAHAGNSVIAFADNSSAIRGYTVKTLQPSAPGQPGAFTVAPRLRHCLLTAETHNFPTGIAPVPGAETGTGGRIRDTHATGRGSHVVAGTTGYCVGNLRVPGYPLPWEDATFTYPGNMADPLTIEIDASNGASDYGNKFGEPVIAGFTRSVGLRLPNGERREYIKPIMFTAGVGAIDGEHVVKGAPETGMVVVKLGGPAYRIGMGGSAASSMMQGENKAELDFNAVQRGDAQMEQKVNRVIRACCELGEGNPIVSIHDQGAGGNCNVLKEIVSPAGGRIDVRAIAVGDATLSVLEIWGAEYQEADALLLRPESVPLFTALCARERAPVAYVGTVTGDGMIVLHDSADGTNPVNMDTEKVLGNMPQKTYESTRADASALTRFEPPAGTTVAGALDRVLRLLSVGSKRFLTNKVDRAVTGLVARQQCVGPLHTPLADVGVLALSHFDTLGTATSIGEQPLKGLVSPAAMGRMAVAEAITNMAAARISGLAEAKCSANWMWAAKLPHEGAAIYDAAVAMADFMIATGVAVDGGKDSLSMAAKAPDGELVKAPGSLVISLYAPCPDVAATLTPDLKAPASGSALVHVTAAPGKARVGGSCLAQVFGAVGDVSQVPDVESPATLVAGFNTIQGLLAAPSRGGLLSLHDVSDGGLLVAALEMAFAGNVGLSLALPPAAVPSGASAFDVLFAEEAGWVLEVASASLDAVLAAFGAAGVPAVVIGAPGAPSGAVTVALPPAAGGVVLDGVPMPALRDAWEATSFQLERRQTNPACVAQEEAGMATRRVPPYALTFTPAPTPAALTAPGAPGKPKVAVLREEGTNGDREMAVALMASGFDVHDITMSDLVAGRAALNASFRGLVFPGGFSYADVLDSGKGWAATIRFNPGVLAQFKAFYERPDTFSLGVCNGCQLAALLGWVPFGPGGSYDGAAVTEATQPRFIHNDSGRFESRFPAVRINDSPAIMLRGMAGSVLGVWLQHGEGKAHFPDEAVLAAALGPLPGGVVGAGGCGKTLVPLQYVDDDGAPTGAYPFNPNGSPHGIAGLTTPDGRHLAMMPHPERLHATWAWPWVPPHWEGLAASPWLRMFQNARTWCDEVPAAGSSTA
jgi:phosphoribosylformylglycinamidine synthase